MPFVDGDYLSKLVTHHNQTEHAMDGADFSDPEIGVTLTSAQLWGRLLRMTREEREKWFAMAQDAATHGMTCQIHGHLQHIDDLNEAIRHWSERAQGYRIAAIAQKAEADEWHARFKRVLALAHQWRAKANEFMVDRDMRAAGVDKGEGDKPCRLHWNCSGRHQPWP